MKVSLWVTAIACLLLGACRDRSSSGATPSTVAAPAQAQGVQASLPQPPLVGVHYFGNAWPINFIGGFRREQVPGDFARIADDGFNSVVLLVSWGDFQPVLDPCCQDDERAWERLHFLLDQADHAGLKVVLRVGYAWTSHPQAGDSSARVHALLNQPRVREDYARFIARLGREVAAKPQVTLAFMAWEDQWLRQIDDSARADFTRFEATRPDLAAPPGAPFPTAQGERAEAFNAYWDWLVINKLYAPARKALPMLSYEARIDKEPEFATDANGVRTIRRWLGHPGMLALPGDAPVTIYWAPFWGSQNHGEKLPATESLRLFDALLSEVRTLAPGKAIYIDQFNVVDNTPGFEANATIAPNEIPAFLDRAVCSMKSNFVVGYAWWAGQDYVENVLYNPAFGYRLDGWQWLGAGDGQTALEAMPSGDFRLRMKPGESVVQRVPSIRGRLPKAETLHEKVCVTADVAMPGEIAVRAGSGATRTLQFAHKGVQTQCGSLSSVPDADSLSLDVAVTARSGDLALLDVKVFDHVQNGGLYDEFGRPGPLLESVRRMNAGFLSTKPLARCAVPTFSLLPPTRS